MNEDIPVSGSVVNPCNGENVNFSGILHLTASLTANSSGGFLMTEHDNIHVTGTGDQGNTYIEDEQDNDIYNVQVGQELTSTNMFNEISQRSAPNYVEKGIFHVTLNPNGTLTAYVDHFTASCLG